MLLLPCPLQLPNATTSWDLAWRVLFLAGMRNTPEKRYLVIWPRPSSVLSSVYLRPLPCCLLSSARVPMPISLLRAIHIAASWARQLFHWSTRTGKSSTSLTSCSAWSSLRTQPLTLLSMPTRPVESGAALLSAVFSNCLARRTTLRGLFWSSTWRSPSTLWPIFLLRYRKPRISWIARSGLLWKNQPWSSDRSARWIHQPTAGSPMWRRTLKSLSILTWTRTPAAFATSTSTFLPLAGITSLPQSASIQEHAREIATIHLYRQQTMQSSGRGHIGMSTPS